MVRKKVVNNNYDQPEIFFKPKNRAQQEAFELYQACDILFMVGPAGSGKTHLSTNFAMYDMFSKVKTRRVDKIVITRPIVEAGEHLGFLPGDISEKVDPYMIPIYDCVSRMVHKPNEFIEQHFEILPLAYMRGVSFINSIAILDEAQNCTNTQLKLFMTRMSEGSKLIITGDLDQSDIGNRSGLRDVVKAFENEEGFGVYRFKEGDIVRHPRVIQMIKKWPGV
jgi:phosphate starvation-inducible PhoH-like protein